MKTRLAGAVGRASMADTRDSFVKKLLAEREEAHNSKTVRLKALREAKEAADALNAPAVTASPKKKAARKK